MPYRLLFSIPVSFVGLCFVMVFLLSACNTTDESAAPSAYSIALEKSMEGKTFYGVLPCASCSGIETRITLDTSHKVTLETLYQEHDSFPTILKGTYTIKDSILTLIFADKEDNRSYKIKSDSIITFLNKEGEEAKEMASFYQLHSLPTLVPKSLEGTYTRRDDGKKIVNRLRISLNKASQTYIVQFTSKENECKIIFDAVTLNANRLLIPLNTLNKEWNGTLTITFKVKKALVYIDNPDHKTALNTFCEGKYMFIGTYIKS